MKANSLASNLNNNNTSNNNIFNNNNVNFNMAAAAVIDTTHTNSNSELKIMNQPNTQQGIASVLTQQQQQQQQQLKTMQQQQQQMNKVLSSTKGGSDNYINGRMRSEPRVNYETYYQHKEKEPENYHPLVQYLDHTELKFYNDNLFYETPMGFPTKASILRDKAYRLPLLKDTPAEKARYRRKLHEKQHNITLARKKYDFKTYEGYSSHYFLTGARYNRYDTIDSKILNKYGIFVNRHNPELIYFTAKAHTDDDEHDTTKPHSEKSSKRNDYIIKTNSDIDMYKSKSIQVPQLTKELELTEKRFSANLTF